MNFKKKIILYPALLFVAIFVLNACSHKRATEVNQEPDPVSYNIMLSEAQIQTANIKVVEARYGKIGHHLTLTGVLKINEQGVVSISARATGRLAKLYFKNTGEQINTGDSIYRFYSEELAEAERKYSTIQRNNWNFSGRYEPSLVLEDRLKYIGMLPSQIAQLRKDGRILFTITLYSTVGGVIKSVNVTEGQYVTEGQNIFELADDSKLWMEAQVYPDEVQLLKTGMPVRVVVPGADMEFRSTLSFVNPSFEPGKIVTLVRTVINNSDRKLYPGMLAMMIVETNKTDGIIVPTSAIINSKSGDRIWIRDEDGSFSFRNISSGIQSSDSTLILSGLNEDDEVVVSGAYLLDSEMQLKSVTSTASEAEL